MRMDSPNKGNMAGKDDQGQEGCWAVQYILLVASMREMELRVAKENSVSLQTTYYRQGIYGLVHKHFLNTLVVPGTGLEGTKNLGTCPQELTTYLERSRPREDNGSGTKYGNARDNDCWESRRIQNAKEWGRALGRSLNWTLKDGAIFQSGIPDKIAKA